MSGENIVCLIKFIREEEYVDKLIEEGELFMRPLGYFVDLERIYRDNIRGDGKEGLLFDCVGVGYSYPVYCMYAVFERDVMPGGLLINARAVNEFNPQGTGYFAVIEYNDFMYMQNKENFDGYSATFNLIKYGSLDRETQEKILVGQRNQVQFVKRIEYSHQQEFRVAVHKNLPKTKPDHESGIYGHEYIRRIGSLGHCAKKYSLDDLSEYDEEYFLLEI